MLFINTLKFKVKTLEILNVFIEKNLNFKLTPKEIFKNKKNKILFKINYFF